MMSFVVVICVRVWVCHHFEVMTLITRLMGHLVVVMVRHSVFEAEAAYTGGLAIIGQDFCI